MSLMIQVAPVESPDAGRIEAMVVARLGGPAAGPEEIADARETGVCPRCGGRVEHDAAGGACRVPACGFGW